MFKESTKSLHRTFLCNSLVQWLDKCVISLLTTLHQDTTVVVERRSRHAEGGREVVQKPMVIVEYNKYMGGVDCADQLLCYCGFGHRTIRWWRRAFFIIVDMAVVNSYILITAHWQKVIHA